MKEYVSNFYKSTVTIRKSVSVLLKTWVDVDERTKFVRDFALDLYERANAEEKVALYYGLMMLSFPIFNESSI
ncbi:MAG TPA: hypothetical protein VIK77_00370 [Tissierellaceae bacterium]